MTIVGLASQWPRTTYSVAYALCGLDTAVYHGHVVKGYHVLCTIRDQAE